MSAKDQVEELKKLAEATETGDKETVKAQFLKLDQASRDLLGLASLMMLLISQKDRVNIEQQADIIQNAIAFYRGSVQLHVLEVILSLLTSVLDDIKDMQPTTEAEKKIIALASSMATFALQIDQDHEKDRSIVANLMELIKPPKKPENE